MELSLLFRGIERLIVASCIPILLILGYKLFVRGATGDIKISVKLDTWSGKAINLSPGALCFLLGAVLGAYVLFNKTTLTSETSSSAALPALAQAAQPTAAVKASPPVPSPSGDLSNRETAKHKKTIPGQLHTNNTANTIKQTFYWNGLDGNSSDDDLPLSFKLRLILSDLYYCYQPSFSDGKMVYEQSEKCVDKINRKFGLNKPPTLEDMNNIEELDRKIANAPADEATRQKLAEMRTEYLKSSNTWR